MRNIISSCYEKTKEIIKSNRKLLDLIANTLLEEETITKEQIDYLVENGHLPDAKEEKAKDNEKTKETKEVKDNKESSK